MGSVIAVEYVCLDGVADNLEWTTPYFNSELQKFQHDNLFQSDALLLGRVTYEAFKSAWPAMPDEQGFADRMNSIRKYAATTTLSHPEWNASFIKGDVAEAVAGLRATDMTLLINGSITLLNYLGRHNLVNEYRLMVFPVLARAGKRLFDGQGPVRPLTLKHCRTTETGVAILTYAPAT